MSDSRPAIWFPTIRTGSGSDVFTETLANSLSERGYRTGITWLPHRAEYLPWLSQRPSPPAWANVTHINSWLPTRFIPRSLPVVATTHLCVHDPVLKPYKSLAQSAYHRIWVKRLESSSLHHAHITTAVSRYTAEMTKATFGAQPVVVHNGISIAPYERPAARRHGRFRLLYVGNWSNRKGSDLLAGIMTELGSEFELLICGRTPSSLPPLPGNCTRAGHLDASALSHNYQQADALLLPTRLEGFGLVAAEAMGHGLPVIATDGSSLPEVVSNGNTGILCPTDDIAAFAAAARLLAANPARATAMGQAGRERARRLFSLTTMVDAYLNVYRECLLTN